MIFWRANTRNNRRWETSSKKINTCSYSFASQSFFSFHLWLNTDITELLSIFFFSSFLRNLNSKVAEDYHCSPGKFYRVHNFCLAFSPLFPTYIYTPMFLGIFFTTFKINLATWPVNVKISSLLEFHTLKAWGRLFRLFSPNDHINCLITVVSESLCNGQHWSSYQSYVRPMTNYQSSYLNGSSGSMKAHKASSKTMLPLTMCLMKNNLSELQSWRNFKTNKW